MRRHEYEGGGHIPKIYPVLLGSRVFRTSVEKYAILWFMTEKDL